MQVTVIVQELTSQVNCVTMENFNMLYICSLLYVFSYSLVPATPPESISARETSANSIEVTWTDPTIPYGVITSYSVQYNTSDGNVISFTTESQQATLEDLDEYTVYEINVSASTRIGFGPYGQVHTRTGQASECK